MARRSARLEVERQSAARAQGEIAAARREQTELLVEAHEVREGPLMTASFFAAFLLILALEIVA